MNIKQKLYIGLIIFPVFFFTLFMSYGIISASNHEFKESIEYLNIITNEKSFEIERKLDDIVSLTSFAFSANQNFFYDKYSKFFNNIEKIILKDARGNTIYEGKFKTFGFSYAFLIYDKEQKIQYDDNNLILNFIILDKDNRFQGRLNLFLRRSFFDDILNGVKVGETGHLALFDNYKNMVYHINNDLITNKITDIPLLTSNDKSKKIEGKFISGAYEYYGIANKIEKYGLILFVMQNTFEMKKIEIEFPLLLFLAVIFGILFTSRYGIRVYEEIISPIDKLISIMKDAKFDNISKLEKIEYENEFKKLFEGYYSLIDRLHQSYRELEELYEELYAQDEEIRAQLEEIKEKESTIKKLEEKQRIALTATKTGIFEYNFSTNDIFATEEFYKIFGLKKDEDYQKILDLLDENIRKDVLDMFSSLDEVGKVLMKEIAFGERNLFIHAKKINDHTIAGIVRDITYMAQFRKQLELKNKYLSSLFNYSPDAIAQIDNKHIIVDVNPAFEALFGYSKEECIGKRIDEIVMGQENIEIAASKTQELFAKGNVNFEDMRYDKLGRNIYINCRGFLIPDNDKILGGYIIYTDITENKKYKEKLEYLSLHDSLTGIYNLAFFQEELKRYSNSREYPISIIVADLNALKIVNDTLGHSKGDELIKACAAAIQSSIRASDILARIGGDEFAVILPKTSSSDAEKIVERIQNNIEKYNKDFVGKGLLLSVSIGIATAMKPVDLRETFRDADEAMYKNKLIDNYSRRRETINVLLAALAEKDFITKGHTDRVKNLCIKLGKKLNLNSKQMSNLILLSEVHDLGKVAIPDSILFKEGPLTEEEWKIMKQHSEKGYRIALSSPELAGIAEFILKHHERYDGSGYPFGLKGEDIPIECRILSIVDAYDAMTNLRPYNKIKTKEEAIEEIKRCSGTHFDPEIANIFIEILKME